MSFQKRVLLLVYVFWLVISTSNGEPAKNIEYTEPAPWEKTYSSKIDNSLLNNLSGAEILEIATKWNSEAESKFGQNSARCLASMNAVVYQLYGSREEEDLVYLIPKLKKAIWICLNETGAESYQSVRYSHMLASACVRTGKKEEGLACLEQTVKNAEQQHGKTDKLTLAALRDLERTYEHAKNYPRAIETHQEILRRTISSEEEQSAKADAIFELMSLYRKTGAYREALEVATQIPTLHNKITDTTLIDRERIYCEIALGNKTQAIKYLRESLNGDNYARTFLYGGLPVNENLPNPFTLAGTVGDPSLLAEVCIKYKNVVAETGLNTQAKRAVFSRTKKGLSMINQLGMVRERERILYASVPRKGNQKLRDLVLPDLRDLTTEKNGGNEGRAGVKGEQNQDFMVRAQTELEERLGRLADPSDGLTTLKNIRVEEVQSALPERAVLVEIVHYNKWVEKNTLESHYSALLLRKKGAPVLVPLGRASVMDEAIVQVSEALEPAPPPVTTASLQAKDRLVQKQLNLLFNLLALPLEKQLQSDERLVWHPDGNIHFVNPAILVDGKGRFWCESRKMETIASCGALLRKSAPPAARTPSALLVHQPNFGRAPVGPLGTIDQLNGIFDGHKLAASLKAGMARSVANFKFDDLPGTITEAESVQQILTSKGWKIYHQSGENASEANLRSQPQTTILHIASHGGVLSSESKASRSQISVDLGEDPRQGRVILQSMEGYADNGTHPARVELHRAFGGEYDNQCLE